MTLFPGNTLASELAERQRVAERLRIVAQASRDFAAATSDYRKLLDVVASTTGTILGDLCSIRLISRDGRWLKEADASIFHADPDVAQAFRRAMQSSPPGRRGWARSGVGRRRRHRVRRCRWPLRSRRMLRPGDRVRPCLPARWLRAQAR